MKISLNMRVVLIVSFFMLVCSGLTSGIFVLRTIKKMNETNRTTLRQGSLTVSYMIQGIDLPSLVLEDLSSDDLYAVWTNFYDATKGFDLAYLYVLQPKGADFEFIWDIADDPRVKADDDNSFTVYEEAPPAAFEALKTEKLTYTAEPYTDEWGTFMSVYRPVLNESGKVIGVIGADIEVSKIKATVAKEVLILLLPVFGFAILLSLVMGFILRASIVNPILAINKALSTIAQGEGDLSKDLPVKGKTEISDLSRSFNMFQDKLSSLINRTRSSFSTLQEVGLDLNASAIETASSLHEITANISSIRKEVGRQADASNLTSETVTKVNETVRTLTDRIETQFGNIQVSSSAIDEITLGIEEVNKAVSNISDMTTKNRDLADLAYRDLNVFKTRKD